MSTEKYINNSALKNSTGKKLHFIIGEGAIKTEHIDNGAVTPEKVADSVINQMVKPLVDSLKNLEDRKIADLQNQIDAIDEHGIAVSNEFGNDPHISISQKTLTEAINNLWDKIEEMTGETLHGITMTVTPQYYIGEEGATIHITANTVETGGIFERIKFYANGTLIAEAENVEYFEDDVTIDETTVIMCKAQIMGVEYTRQEIVTHYNSYWLGCGADYQAVMINDNLKPITEGMRANYDVTCAQGDHIIIILGETLRPGFIRADMNSFEIPFVETTVTVNGNTYAVLTSVNTYQAGTYNIDING